MLPRELESELLNILDGPSEHWAAAVTELCRRNPDSTTAIRQRVEQIKREFVRGGADATKDLTDQVLSGKYRIRRLLGRGGVGAVYEAVDEMLGATVAVKVLRAEAAAQQDALDEFLGEAKRLTSLDHPNIVRWITFDRTPAGIHYFVMEHLRGEELSELLAREGRLRPRRVVEILLQILAALRQAHNLPDGGALLHLDLKPKNVFVVKGPPELVKVIDFGMSQHVGAAARTAEGIQLVATASDLEHADVGESIATKYSTTVPPPGGATAVRRARGGTLLYASPEQCKHLAGDADIVELDARADLYSLGMMAYEMLTGALPWRARTPLELIKAHQERPLPKLGKLRLKAPRELLAFVERCLAKNRDDRYPSAAAACEALAQVANPPSRWPKLVGVGVLAAAIAVYAAWPEKEPGSLDVTTEQGALFFGPRQPARVVEVRNVLPEFVGDGVQVTLVADPRDPRTKEPELPGWRATLERAEAGTTRLGLEAPAEVKGIVDRQLYVRVAAPSSRRVQHSGRIRFVYLGQDAWRLDEPDIQGRTRTEAAVDPIGAVLEIPLLGAQREHVTSVEVRLEQQSFKARRDEDRAGGARDVYTLDLTRFGPFDETSAPRAVEIGIQVTDRVGNQEQRTLALTLDARPLQSTFTVELVGCPRVGQDSYVIYPQPPPTLRCDFHSSANTGSPSAPRVGVAITDLDVRGADGQAVPVERQPLPDGERLRIAFPRPDQPANGEITIKVADDPRTIHHPDRSRGEAERSLRYSYQPDPLALRVSPEPPASVSPADARLFYTNTGTVKLRLEGDLPATAKVTCQSAAPPSRDLDLTQRRVQEATFALATDGAHAFTVDAFRYLGRGQPEPEAPESQQELVVVLDTGRPELTVLQPPQAAWTRAPSPEDPLVTLGIADPAADAERPTPLTWRWELVGPEAARGTVAVVPAASRALRWRDLEPDLQDLQDLQDGRYQLSQVLADAAGNESPPAPCEFEIACRPPASTLKSPPAGRWAPLTENRFQVLVHASDPNGVDAVVCALRDDRNDRAQPALSLTPPADRTDGDWLGEFALPQSWANAPVTLRWTVRDRHGNAMESEPRSFVLADFEVRRLPRIEPRLHDHPNVPVAAMRFVKGDSGYVAGGRIEAEEAGSFEAHGLTYDTLSLNRSEDVADYYLDETEVTVGQFLVFVLAADGYANDEHWTGSPPPAERRLEQRRRLEARDSELPVTDITWFEAAAYAHWVGKRLPTLLEWEYAVRGGRAYRPFSCPGFDPAEFNVDLAAEKGVAWTVLRGMDVTPGGVGEGIRNLCSNVEEWTQTEGPRSQWRFSAGASFAAIGRNSYAFNAQRMRDPTRPLAYLGFRCALAAGAVDEALDGIGRIRIDPGASKEVRQR